MSRILIIVTSADEYADAGYRTGLWLGELTHFWDVAEKAGHTMEIASIAGGKVPLDPESLGAPVLAMGGTKKRYRDRNFMNLLVDTKSVAQVSADDYDAIYLTGGHGTMFDFPESRHLGRLIGAFADQGKIVSAVCHGPTGLLNATRGNGKAFLEGCKVTGFSWAEEKVAGRRDVVPFNLEKMLGAKSRRFTKARVPMGKHVVVDGNLVTGQNPTSAKGVAQAVVKLLAKR
ncbi:type 1 glutamine amidotransferase domain-containing protein [Mariniluteicoccus flavus]